MKKGQEKMEISVQIKKEIRSEKQLAVMVQGKLSGEVDQLTKVRLTAIFSDGEMNRRIPIPTELLKEEKECYFSGNGEISLKDVFLYGTKAEEVTVTIEAEYLGERVRFDEKAFVLDGRLFYKQPRKYGFGYSFYKAVLAIGSVCWLPVMLIDGYVAGKGYKELELNGKRASGKKAIIFHANNKIKAFTGFSFSVREHKTNYFEKCYRKYAKKPCKKNQILFLSERRVEPNGNLDLIRADLKSRGKFEIVECLTEKTIDKMSRKEIRQTAKQAAVSKLIILEDFYPQLHALDLRKETKVVQLWHACGAFKTFGFSRLGKPGGPAQDSRNHRSYDYSFVSGNAMEDIYSEAFAIPTKNVKALGVPRTDIFFDKGYQADVKQKLYEKYPQLKDKKVVLFAPTFRGDGNKDAHYPKERFSVDAFMENVPDDYLLIVKHHPFVKQPFSFSEKYSDRVLDFSQGEQINDLLFLTDVLVTDYSSSIFEAALLDIPMVFYVFDKQIYMQERDIYSDFESFVPGEMVMEEQELSGAVVRAANGTGESPERMEQFKSYFLDALDGNSTKRIGEFLAGIMES